MRVLCLSASNVVRAKASSASTRVCKLIEEMVVAAAPEAQVEVTALVDLEPRFCMMCGDCTDSMTCPYDEHFNRVFAQMQAADAVFIVCPHYAPVPAKLMVILEKLEEMAYIKYCEQKLNEFPLHGKPTGLVAHGGMYGDGVDEYYTKGLLNPLASALQSCGFKPVSPDGESKGVVFGVKGHLPVEGSVFPAMDHDWDLISERVRPLVDQILARLQAE